MYNLSITECEHMLCIVQTFIYLKSIEILYSEQSIAYEYNRKILRYNAQKQSYVLLSVLRTLNGVRGFGEISSRLYAQFELSYFVQSSSIYKYCKQFAQLMLSKCIYLVQFLVSDSSACETRPDFRLAFQLTLQQIVNIRQRQHLWRGIVLDAYMKC